MAAIAARCDIIAQQIPGLKAHLLNELMIADGHPSRGERAGGRGNAELTPTEAAAEAAMLAQAKLDQLADDLAVLDTMTLDLGRMITFDLRWRVPTDQIKVALCDGRKREGFIPGKHDTGWGDPLCRTIAEPNGICLRCARAERRWRSMHGLPDRRLSKAGVSDAA